jgi:branched-chain amino acid transport system ATP-binding protein
VVDPPGDEVRSPQRTATEALRIEEVSVAFGGLTALDRVSLSVGRNEIVGVIGPNGAGKTTLFNVICGFVRPQAGRIFVGDRLLRRHQPHDLTSLGVARTLQATRLPPGLSVLENVMAGTTLRSPLESLSALLGLPGSSRTEGLRREVARATLARLGIAEYADRPPVSLPHAVARRVALARALAGEPRLLLLDEPASGLSDGEQDDLRLLLHELRDSMSVLLVEHHMDLVMATCDRIVVLDFGRVIAGGTPEAIRADPAVAEAYLGRELSAAEETDAGG